MMQQSTLPHIEEPAPILLANTVSVDRRGMVHDALGEHVDLQRWAYEAAGRLTLSPRRTGADLLDDAAARQLVSLRDAVRRLAAERTRDPRAFGHSPVRNVAAATRIINDCSGLSFVWPEMHMDGLAVGHREVWAGGTFGEALVTVLARRTIALIEGAEWEQLRPCVAPNCAYFFVKNHVRRQWCSPACGNRARVARHAQRHRDG